MMQHFVENLIHWDQALFFKINGSWTHSVLDQCLPWVRTSENWFPFYAFFIIYLLIKKGKTTWKYLLFIIVTVALTDQLSSQICKPFFHRLRPCADPQIVGQVKLIIDYCATSFSFTSSHAANHFGISVFICMTLQPVLKKYRYLFLVWAGIISYAQVYVGVHYPLDVMGGAFIGIVVGWVLSKLYFRWIKPAII